MGSTLKIIMFSEPNQSEGGLPDFLAVRLVGLSLAFILPLDNYL